MLRETNGDANKVNEAEHKIENIYANKRKKIYVENALWMIEMKEKQSHILL